MASYLLSFSWGISILCSFIGWGSAINSILFPSRRVDWGQRAAWGVAFSILVGGVLNVTWTISKITVLVCLGTGLLFWLFDLYKTLPLVKSSTSQQFYNHKNDRPMVLGIFITCLLLFLQYGGWVSSRDFMLMDDFHAYLVFPQKMLQTGSMGLEPFSERRMFALGGQSFLHTFILSTLPEKNLQIIDPGLGFIITVGLLWGYLKIKRVTKGSALFILVFFLLVPLPKANISALVIPLALFLSIFRTFDWEELKNSDYKANGFIIALLAAAICTLKSNLIPACSILVFLSYSFYCIATRKPAAIYEFLMVAVLTVLFLLPWMLSFYLSSGTMLYPLLGKGYHGSAYGGTFTVPWSWSEYSVLKSLKILIDRLRSPSYFSVLLLLGFYYLVSRPRKLAGREASLSLAISAFLGSLPFLWGSLGYLERYTFSYMFAAIIVLMVSALSDTEMENKYRLAPSTALLIIGCIAGLLINKSFFMDINRNSVINNFKFAVHDSPLVPDEEVSKYKRMQQSIPQGVTVLTRLSKPFLLDFNRNIIFIADWPGAASLPPGMPAFKGPEALADYLVSKSIQYVAYSYGDEANYPRAGKERDLDLDNWHKTNASHTFDFQDNLSALGTTRKRIFDDGEIFVLDLMSRQG